MAKFATLLLTLLSVFSVAAGFVVAPAAFARTPSSSTSLGIFGGGKKKPAPKKGGGKDLSVFGGKGNRITVREDEDAAMWIEGEDGSRQSAIGDNKKKGK